MTSMERDRPQSQTAGSDQRPARQLAGAALHFDLAEQVASLKREPSWLEGDRNGKTLVQESSFRVVLSVLKAGTLVREHSAPGWASIQTLEGHVRLRVPDHGVVDLPAGSLLVLQPNVQHDVEAVEESAFLLAVALA